jgi:cation diffusion facilitator family transporter
MAHLQRQVGLAVAVNAAICGLEALAGFASGSLSLVMDSVHNLSDEFALVLLYLALRLPHEPSRHAVRAANLFNSLGLVAVSGLLAYQAVLRLISPAEVPGTVPIVVGILAAGGNLLVARLLLQGGRTNAALRLAYLHNLGDVFVSLSPVLSGLLILVLQQSLFDPLCALGIAGFFIYSTVREVITSRHELLWPGSMVCGHDNSVPAGSEHEAQRSVDTTAGRPV